MAFIDLVGLLTLACIPAFILLDLLHRAYKFESPRFWRARALAVTVVNVALSFVIPVGWAKLVGDNTLFNLSGLGLVSGTLVGVVTYQIAHYWYHRTVHKSDVMFRWFHQMHHSAESLDAWGAYFLSPLDAAGFISISSLVFVPVLGLSTEVAVVAAFILTFCAMFQHANLRTPHWVGYLVQRPESHTVHHQRGLHKYNYADLPLIDMIFGTFRNPETFEGECGFYDGASSRIGEMLVGRDVTTPPLSTGASDDESPLEIAA